MLNVGEAADQQEKGLDTLHIYFPHFFALAGRNQEMNVKLGEKTIKLLVQKIVFIKWEDT